MVQNYWLTKTLHPWRLTCLLKSCHPKRRIVFQPSFFRPGRAVQLPGRKNWITISWPIQSLTQKVPKVFEPSESDAVLKVEGLAWCFTVSWGESLSLFKVKWYPLPLTNKHKITRYIYIRIYNISKGIKVFSPIPVSVYILSLSQHSTSPVSAILDPGTWQ